MYSSTYFMLFTELKVCWIDSVKQLDNPVKHKRIVNGPHRKKSNGCLHEFVVIACSWKSCDLRCVFRYYVFFPLENNRNSRNVAIHSFLRFLLNTNWEQLFRVDNIAKQQDLCCKEFPFCWSTKQTKIGGLMEPSFPFLFQLQFRWKKIMPNYVDNCPWLLFHCFCGPDRS